MKFQVPGGRRCGRQFASTFKAADMSRETARQVLRIEAEAITELINRLDESFDRALELLVECQGRVVTTGMGKSGVICQKIASTLAGSGTPAFFLHPAEAVHGDLGMLTSGDLVIALSNSGETEEILRLLETVKRWGIPLIALVGNTDSALAQDSDVVLDVSVDQEACPFGLAPTASSTAALALGDALAIALSERKDFRAEDFARLHPGGRLGRRLAEVSKLMHAGDQIPRVTTETPMDQVIYEMSRKGLGVTSVVEGNGRLVGVISDGDLRRLLEKDQEKVLSRTAGQCMTRRPATVEPDSLAGSALNLMEERSITSLMVVGKGQQIIGVIHLHDLWGTEMF